LQIVFPLLVLVCVAQLGRQSLASYANRTYTVGEGRDRFYAYTPNISGDGAILNIVTSILHINFPDVKTVVALPESMAVNYYSRKPSPVATMQYVPDALSMAGLDQVLAELKANPPDVMVLYARDMHEYGVAYFGADEKSGKGIVDWVVKDYNPVFAYGQTPFSFSGHVIDIYVRPGIKPKR